MRASRKEEMLAMICITKDYESSTARAAAAVLGVVYVPHTMAECLVLIDRASHRAYIGAVTAAVLARVAPPAAPDPFSESLADAHSELQSVSMSIYPEIIGILYMLVLVLLILTGNRLSKLRTVSLLW